MLMSWLGLKNWVLSWVLSWDLKLERVLQASLADIAYQIAYVNAYQRHRFALADIAYQIAQASPTTIAYFAAGKWAGQHACTKTGQTYDQHGLVSF